MTQRRLIAYPGRTRWPFCRSPCSPRTRRRLIVLAVLAVASIGVLACLMATHRITESSFRAEVEADLPPGTPRAEVEAWLRGRGIPFIGLVDKDRRPVGLSGEVPHVYYIDLLFYTVIQFSISFDADGRRTSSFDANEFWYGP